jgi:hypothetical protein
MLSCFNLKWIAILSICGQLAPFFQFQIQKNELKNKTDLSILKY